MTSDAPNRILIVDDEEINRDLLQDMLALLGYQADLAADGSQALSLLNPSHDLLLVNGMMPGMDGFALIRQIRCHDSCSDVPVIMVTALSSKGDRLQAVEAGANDFIAKPVDLMELRIRVASLIKMKQAQDEVKRHQATLEQQVASKTAELRQALDEVAAAQEQTYAAHLDTIQRLSLAAEHRDNQTAAHIERVSHYCGLIAWALDMTSEETEVVRQASRMHDVGKIGIPDRILHKPSLLTKEERQVMEEHTLIGARILGGSTATLLQAGEQIALSHHEHWDGGGYPLGLAGEQIPLYGRICAVADVFDALTSRRPYKDAFPLEEARQFLEIGRGSHFEPRILDLFLANFDVVEAIMAIHSDD